MVPLLYLPTKADRAFVGIGIGAIEVFPSVTGRDAQRDNVLIVPAANLPLAARMPWGIIATPLILDVVLVLTGALRFEANGTFPGIGHGAGERFTVIARLDLDSDDILVVPPAE